MDQLTNMCMYYPHDFHWNCKKENQENVCVSLIIMISPHFHQSTELAHFHPCFCLCTVNTEKVFYFKNIKNVCIANGKNWRTLINLRILSFFTIIRNIKSWSEMNVLTSLFDHRKLFATITIKNVWCKYNFNVLI